MLDSDDKSEAVDLINRDLDDIKMSKSIVSET